MFGTIACSFFNSTLFKFQSNMNLRHPFAQTLPLLADWTQNDTEFWLTSRLHLFPCCGQSSLDTGLVIHTCEMLQSESFKLTPNICKVISDVKEAFKFTPSQFTFRNLQLGWGGSYCASGAQSCFQGGNATLRKHLDEIWLRKAFLTIRQFDNWTIRQRQQTCLWVRL